MDPLDVFLFGVFPYVALLMFVVGVLWRFSKWVRASGTTGLYSVNVFGYAWGFDKRLSETLKRIFTLYTLNTSDRLVLVGSFLFHWGIWIALLGHLAMIVPPYQFGVSKELHKAIALYVGGAAGIAALIGLVLLLVRRLIRADVRKLSFLDDWFALVLLIAIVALGNYQALVIRPDYMNTLSPWLQNILLGNVSAALTYVAELDVVSKLHVFLGMVFIAYVPLGKMIHPFSYAAMPTIWKKPTDLYGYRVWKSPLEELK
ncbi:MAG: respiratory nitrate reductase subunit gamma [Pyrobaculum sp.]